MNECVRFLNTCESFLPLCTVLIPLNLNPETSRRRRRWFRSLQFWGSKFHEWFAGSSLLDVVILNGLCDYNDADDDDWDDEISGWHIAHTHTRATNRDKQAKGEQFLAVSLNGIIS